MTDDQYRLYGQLPPDEVLAELEQLEATQEIPSIMGEPLHAGPDELELVRLRLADWRNAYFAMTALALALCIAGYFWAGRVTTPGVCPAPVTDVMQLKPAEIRSRASEVYEL
jgi:hypothetical protein